MNLRPQTLRSRDADASTRWPRCVAHRGASHRAPENTMAAIERALTGGADAVEVDVRRTRDGALVLMHDTTLVRTTDARAVYPHRAPWRVSDFTLAELHRLDAGSWKSRQYAGEQVPELRHALEAVRRAHAEILVEVKTPGLYPGVVEDVMVALHVASGFLDGWSMRHRVTVQSFDFAAMKALKSLEPQIRVGLLGAPPISHLPALASWADEINPYHGRVDRAYVAHMHDLGLRCQAWTADRATDMRRLLQLGVDGVITNRPGKLLRQMPSRKAPRG